MLILQDQQHLGYPSLLNLFYFLQSQIILKVSSGGHAVPHHHMPEPPSQSAERPGLSALFNFIGAQVLILVLRVSHVQHFVFLVSP